MAGPAARSHGPRLLRAMIRLTAREWATPGGDQGCRWLNGIVAREPVTSNCSAADTLAPLSCRGVDELRAIKGLAGWSPPLPRGIVLLRGFHRLFRSSEVRCSVRVARGLLRLRRTVGPRRRLGQRQAQGAIGSLVAGPAGRLEL